MDELAVVARELRDELAREVEARIAERVTAEVERQAREVAERMNEELLKVTKPNILREARPQHGALTAWLKRWAGLPLTDDDRRWADTGVFDLQAFVVRIDAVSIPQPRMQLTVTSAPHLVPTIVADQLVAEMDSANAVRQVADVIITQTTEPYTIPVFDDRSNDAELLGEGSAPTGTAEPAATYARLDAFRFQTNVIGISQRLLRDSPVDIERYVAQELGRRIGRTENRYYTTGTGSGQPQGIVNVPHDTVDAVSWQEVKNQYLRIDPIYRSRSVWMFGSTGLQTVTSFADNTGRPVILESLMNPGEFTLMGRRVVENPALDGASNVVCIVGDFSRVKIREHAEVVIKIDPLRHMERDLIAICATHYADCRIAAASTTRAIRALVIREEGGGQ